MRIDRATSSNRRRLKLPSLFLIALWAGSVLAQTTQFTYQGRLSDGVKISSAAFLPIVKAADVAEEHGIKLILVVIVEKIIDAIIASKPE
jgi:hypothetical protein